jgi:SAM-dependent methyltransferase
VHETRGNLYDFPRYYDLVFGADWKEEFAFLRKCFARHAGRAVRRVFEPACGTGRLLLRLAKAGFDVAGNDLNPQAVDYCNARLARHGFAKSAIVGDMADFRVRRKVDAAFNLINSFRHLPSESAAESHLRCMADAVAAGGLYVLCLHLTPTAGPRIGREEWSGRRGNLAVIARLWSAGLDLRKRNERIGMTFDIWTPTRQFRLRDEMNYRTYTLPQFRGLLKRSPAWEVAATYDFRYDVDLPIVPDAATEDIVFVLRRR